MVQGIVVMREWSQPGARFLKDPVIRETGPALPVLLYFPE